MKRLPSENTDEKTSPLYASIAKDFCRSSSGLDSLACDLDAYSARNPRKRLPCSQVLPAKAERLQPSGDRATEPR